MSHAFLFPDMQPREICIDCHQPKHVNCPSCGQPYCVTHGLDHQHGGCDGNDIKLRPYQLAAVESIFNELENNNSTLSVLPTGTGKTVIMAEVCRRWKKGRILLLAHREELIFQGAEKIGKVSGESCDIEMASLRADQSWERSKVVCASVQTLNSGKRCPDCRATWRAAKRNWQDDNPDSDPDDFPGKVLGCDNCLGGMIRRVQRLKSEEFGLLLVDEAHHATAKTYRRIIEYLKTQTDIKILGVTATPDRADEAALGAIFDSVATEYSMLDAINDGWLVDIDQELVEVDEIDLSEVSTRMGDLAKGQVESIMRQEEICHKVASTMIQRAAGRKSLIFCAGVQQAHLTAEIINRHLPGEAMAIDGKTRKDERRAVLNSYAKGQFQFLVNCECFTEGFDDPGVQVIGGANPTKSRSRYAQMIGRGTRPLPGVVDGLQLAADRRAAIAKSDKPNMLVIDFVGNAGRHKLSTVADILGGNEVDAVIDQAVKQMKERSAAGLASHVQDEIEKAKIKLRQFEEAKERERKRRKKLKVKTTFRSRKVNPFNVLDITPPREPAWHKGRQPTDRMKQALRKWGVDDASVDRMRFVDASRMLDELSKRCDQGLCSYKQSKLLKRYGYDTTNMQFAEASNIITRLAANNWKR
jgi:superfamily II DNA or RNA helicase